jgi:hypothetical protein
MVELTGNIRPFRGPWYGTETPSLTDATFAQKTCLTFYPEFLAGDVVTQFDS